MILGPSSSHAYRAPEVRRNSRSALPSPLKSPTPTTLQSAVALPGEPCAMTVVPSSSHIVKVPEVCWNRMSALPSPLKSRFTAIVKVAVTFRACVMLTMQLLVPLHPSPFQPVKVEPLAAVAVSVTLCPWVKGTLQVLPQLTPAGLEVTVPLPVPALLTVRRNCGGVVLANVHPMS